MQIVVFALHAAFRTGHRFHMANLIITYWRDIPSAVSVKIGRKEETRMLDTRFMAAIEMAAMRSGATQSDDYLNDWRRSEPVVVYDDMAAEVEKAKAHLESHYTHDLIKALIATGGKASS